MAKAARFACPGSYVPTIRTLLAWERERLDGLIGKHFDQDLSLDLDAILAAQDALGEDSQ